MAKKNTSTRYFQLTNDILLEYTYNYQTIDLGGKNKDNGIVLAAHIDTLGAMVCEVKANGNLRVSPLGGMNPNNAEAENCRIITRIYGVYEGTFQLDNASVHVNGEYDDTNRKYSGMEVVLDEEVASKEDTKKLGIITGDIVCFDPRTTITKSGYIKSRFLDDKLSVGILLGYAKYLKDENIDCEIAETGSTFKENSLIKALEIAKYSNKIILADEPTGALDYNTSKEILKLIETVNQRYGNTIIMVTHNDAIKDMADRVVKLRDGMIRKNYRNEVKIPAINLEW